MSIPDEFTSFKEAVRVLKPYGVFLLISGIHSSTTILSVPLVNPFLSNFQNPHLTSLTRLWLGVIKVLRYQAGFGDIEISVLPRTSKVDTAKNVAL